MSAPPGKVRAATADYRAEMDWMSEFLKEKCVLREGAKTKAGELYGALGTWWSDDDDGLPSQSEFGRRLRTAGLRSFKKGVKWWSGIALQ